MKRLLDDIVELGLGCGLLVVAWSVVAVLIGFPIKWLWNWIMPTIFDLPEISFWMALAMALLISFLFGGVVKINKK
jgi:hypothetical protein